MLFLTSQLVEYIYFQLYVLKSSKTLFNLNPKNIKLNYKFWNKYNKQQNKVDLVEFKRLNLLTEQHIPLCYVS